MPWVKIDDGLPNNRKWKRLMRRCPEASALWVSALCWAASNLTDGLIDADDLEDVVPVRKPQKLAEALVEVGLWERHGDDYMIHDYLVWNPSAAEVLAKREEERQRKATQRKRGQQNTGRGPDGQYRPKVVPPDVPPGHPPGHPPDDQEDTHRESQGVSTATRPVPSRPVKPTSKEPAPPDPGQSILQAFWDASDPKPAQPWPAMLGVVRKMLTAGWSPDDVLWALHDAPAVSTAALTYSLKRRGKPNGNTPAARSEEAMLAWLASEEARA